MLIIQNSGKQLTMHDGVKWLGEFSGINVYSSPSVAPGTIEIRDTMGNMLCALVNIGGITVPENK